MKTIRWLVRLLALVGLLAACRPCDGAPQADKERPAGKEAPEGCTVFTIVKGDRVIFGGNDDYIKPDSYVWIEPGLGDNYGVVWIGMPTDVQQGVNEKGLAYDGNGLPAVEMNPHLERLPWPTGIASPVEGILHECATVEEVIEWVQTHQVESRTFGQRQFADASGDAVLISPGLDGEWVFSRKAPGDGYLVSTNFNVTDPEHRNGGYPCWRYDTAQEILRDLMQGSGEITAQDAADVLDAVHQESESGWTAGSMVADLPNGLVYLYYYYQFDRPVVLNVADELAHPRAPGPLSRLFPVEVQQEGTRRYTAIQAASRRCGGIGMAWIASVLATVMLVLVFALVRERARSEPRALLFWVPVGLVLGPLGFVVWLIAAFDRGRQGTGGRRWRKALLEATGDVTPTVVAFAVYMVLVVLGSSVWDGDLAQLALIAGLPPTVSLIVQVPLLVWASGRGVLRTLWERLPHALTAANLGMAGVHAVSAPLSGLCMQGCSVFSTPGWQVGTLWSTVAVGALLGGLLLFIHHMWAVKRGLWAWRAVASREEQARSASWRKLWWWVLVSYAVLPGGLVVSVVLQQLFSA